MNSNSLEKIIIFDEDMIIVYNRSTGHKGVTFTTRQTDRKALKYVRA